MTSAETDEPSRSRLEIRQEVFDLCRQFGVPIPDDWVTWPPPPSDHRLLPGHQQELPF